MNKTEEKVTINEQNKAENNNTICLPEKDWHEATCS